MALDCRSLRSQCFFLTDEDAENRGGRYRNWRARFFEPAGVGVLFSVLLNYIKFNSTFWSAPTSWYTDQQPESNRNLWIFIHMSPVSFISLSGSLLFLRSLNCKANTSLAPAHMAVCHWLYPALKSTLFVLSLLWGIYLVRSLAFRGVSTWGG